jgi:phage tail protein X
MPTTLPGTAVVKDRHLPLDLLLWRAYGRAGNTAAMLSAAFKLNPGLAALGPEIPLLTRVILPDLPTPAPATRKVVSLFD